MTTATPQQIRKWALARGYSLAPTGPLPNDIVVAYEHHQLNLSGAVVPTAHHTRTARALVRKSQRAGAPDVLAAVDAMHYDDLPLLIVALARLGWDRLDGEPAPKRSRELKHGDRAGYAKHIRHGIAFPEDSGAAACGCRAANVEYTREWKGNAA